MAPWDGLFSPPAALVAQIVLGSCPLVWHIEDDKVNLGPEERSREALARHVRQVGGLEESVSLAAQRRHQSPVVLVAVDHQALSKRSGEDVLLQRAWEAASDKLVKQLGSERQRTANDGDRPCMLPNEHIECAAASHGGLLEPAVKAYMILPGAPSWSTPASLFQSCSMLDVRRFVSQLPAPDRLKLAIHETGTEVGWRIRPQPVVWRLHGAQASLNADQSLSLSCVALAMCLAAVNDLLAPSVGDRWRAAWGRGGLQELLVTLWHKCGANLYRQAVASGAEPPLLDKESGVLASTASRFSGLTGGMASSLFRKAVAGVSAASHVLSAMALPSARQDGIQWLVLLRTASALEARRKFRRHGRLAALEEALWEQRCVRIFCGTWNVKGKVLPSGTFVEWFRSSLEQWGPEGADVYVVGLQEGVELGAVNLLKDAGTAFVDVLDADSPPDSPRASDVIAQNSVALASWQNEIEVALGEVHAGARLEVVAARQLVGVMLFVLAAPSVKSLITNVATETCRTGLGGMTGNKGAVAVRMQVCFFFRLIFQRSDG